MKEKQPVDPRYQFEGSCDYEKNRQEVAEIYGVPAEDVHHIVFRRDVKGGHFRGILDKRTVNQKANLYPFSDTPEAEENHTTKRDHDELHKKVDEQEGYTGTTKKSKRAKRGTVYSRKFNNKKHRRR